MGIEENKEVVRRFIDEVFNKGDYSIIPDLIAQDYIMNAPAGNIEGQEGVKKYVKMVRIAFPNIKITIEDIVGEEDTVVARINWEGTFSGKFMDYEPTGNQVYMKESLFHRFSNGKQVEVIPYYADQQPLFQQMGIIHT
jgi:predicted ester cyclase